MAEAEAERSKDAELAKGMDTQTGCPMEDIEHGWSIVDNWKYSIMVVRERSALRAVVIEALGRYSVYSSSAGYQFRKPTLHAGRPGEGE